MSAPVAPPRPRDGVDAYVATPPPAPSPRLAYWLARIEGGWTANRRIRAMGYLEASHWFGVYVWEYVNVLSPRLVRR